MYRNHFFPYLQVVRLACYACKLYGCAKDEKPWQKAGSQLSHARMLLRLFDDIPMIRHTYNYGLGRHVSIISYFIMLSSSVINFNSQLLDKGFILERKF